VIAGSCCRPDLFPGIDRLDASEPINSGENLIDRAAR